jgi:hypothetical protein
MLYASLGSIKFSNRDDYLVDFGFYCSIFGQVGNELGNVSPFLLCVGEV